MSIPGFSKTVGHASDRLLGSLLASGALAWVQVTTGFGVVHTVGWGSAPLLFLLQIFAQILFLRDDDCLDALAHFGSVMPPFTLYHFDHSICGTMIRLTFGARAATEPGYTEAKVDIDGCGQLEEDYLRMNWKGHVPILVDGDKVVLETRVITDYLGSFLPSLYPREHLAHIDALLDELHKHNFWTITYALRPDGKQPDLERGHKIRDSILARMARPDTSDAYRHMLERKLAHHNNVKLDQMSDEAGRRRIPLWSGYVPVIEVLTGEHEKLHLFFTHLSGFLASSGGPYLFGSRLTVADCQVAALMNRLHNVGKDSLIDRHQGLLDYARRLLAVPCWQGLPCFGSRK